MRRPLFPLLLHVAVVALAVGFAGCATTGDEPRRDQATDPPATAPTEDSGDCGPPLVGHWKQSDADTHDYFARPAAGETSGAYVYVANGTKQAGRYDIVHQEPEDDCPYTVVAFLVFLKDEPGVATWNFTSPTAAQVENDRACPDRPGNVTVGFVDEKQGP